MPDSTTVATVFPPAASAASRTFSCFFSPTRFHEDPENKTYLHTWEGALIKRVV